MPGILIPKNFKIMFNYYYKNLQLFGGFYYYSVFFKGTLRTKFKIKAIEVICLVYEKVGKSLSECIWVFRLPFLLFKYKIELTK